MRIAANSNALVFADSDGIPTTYAGSNDYYVKYGLENVGKGDPLPMFAALSASTKHLGLAPTLSTTFLTPQLLAQAVGTLDHLNEGRAGWNSVTSPSAHNVQNYGMDDLPESNERYDQADCMVEDVEDLWANANAGAGPQNKVRLQMPPLPQGKPSEPISVLSSFFKNGSMSSKPQPLQPIWAQVS